MEGIIIFQRFSYTILQLSLWCYSKIPATVVKFSKFFWFIVGWDWLKYFSWDRDVLCPPPPPLQDHPGRGEPGPRHHGAPAGHDGGQERARDSQLQGEEYLLWWNHLCQCELTLWVVDCEVPSLGQTPAQSCVGVLDDTTHTVFISPSIRRDTNYRVISLFLSQAPLQSLMDYHHVNRI